MEVQQVQQLAQRVTRKARHVAKRLQWRALDQYDRLTGKADEFTPPRALRFIGGGDFKKVGENFVQIFRETCQLKPNERVLDVGCGIGRMAIPLGPYLAQGGGSYEGLDIVRDGIAWCQRTITPRYPHARFQVADVFNKFYNPRGAHTAAEYRFPFRDGEFDFVFLTSVFTHLLPAELDRYTSEIARVMKPGARAFLTYFLLTPESRAAIDRNTPIIKFSHQYDAGCLVESAQVPEMAIAYPREHVLDLLERCGLQVQEPIRYGWWAKGAGRKTDELACQDAIIVRKLA
jgi:SAM-dependent methyltransferase